MERKRGGASIFLAAQIRPIRARERFRRDLTNGSQDVKSPIIFSPHGIGDYHPVKRHFFPGNTARLLDRDPSVKFRNTGKYFLLHLSRWNQMKETPRKWLKRYIFSHCKPNLINQARTTGVPICVDTVCISTKRNMATKHIHYSGIIGMLGEIFVN